MLDVVTEEEEPEVMKNKYYFSAAVMIYIE
jgi:hypothetical protein